MIDVPVHPADFAATADGGGPGALGGGGSGGPTGPAGAPAGAVRRRRRRRLLRRPRPSTCATSPASPSTTARRRTPACPGQFLVGGEEVVLFADSRYTIQAAPPGPGRADRGRVRRPAGSLAGARGLARGAPGGRRGRVRAARRRGTGWRRPRRTSSWCRSRAGSRPIGRSRSPASSSASPPPAPSPTGRWRSSSRRSARDGRNASSPWSSSGRCGRAARTRSPSTSRAWPARRPRCPHGSPGDRPVRDRAVLLFDFGAQVAGYRSDMTRTLFVGEPEPRDLAVYELVAAAQAAVDRRDRGRGPRRAADLRPGRRRPGPRRHRGGRPRRALRARDGPRDRPGDPRAAVARHARLRRAAPVTDRLLDRAGGLPRRRDRRPDRGSRRLRHRGRAGSSG